jgi:hypothetical protein
VSRDGSINDLLRDAEEGRFDAVIVESIDRLSRMTADATQVEQARRRSPQTKSWQCWTRFPICGPTIETAIEEELAELFRALDLRITHDKSRQQLGFTATITSELLSDLNETTSRGTVAG